jgi:AraC-like DNA-binding protein
VWTPTARRLSAIIRAMAERLFLRLDGDPVHAPETSLPAGTLSDHAVRPSLRSCVSDVLAYREHIPDGHECTERVLPDGAVRLIVHLGDMSDAGPRAIVAGPSTAPVLLRMRGHLHGLSVRLRPGAASAVVGLPLNELSGQAIALDDLWPGLYLPDCLMAASNDAQRVALLQDVIEQRVDASRDTTAERQSRHAARLISDAGGAMPLRDVATAIGLGERRLQQLFQRHIGLTPRAWSRLARLHACLRALRQPAPLPWAQLAVDAGFYDQAHLANEFRALSGLSPSEFRSRTIAQSSKTPG